MKTTFTILLFCVLSIQNLIAQTGIKPQENKIKFSLEIDPATFFMKGYGLHLRIQPKTCDHLLFGLGAYSLDLPKAMVDFNKENKGKGWDVRIQHGLSLFGEHHFTTVNQKWFIGAQAGVQKFRLKQEHSENETTYSNALAMTYVGYTFNPFNNNIYIKPWVGLGYTTKISGENTLNNQSYDIAPLTYFATLHIGYTF